MSDLTPESFPDVDAWYEKTRRFPDLDPVVDDVTVAPERVRAGEAPLEWTVSYAVRDEPLPTGAHVALEIPIHFGLDHGRPYPVGTTHVGHAADVHPGYAAGVDVRTAADAEFAFAVSNTGRFSVVDAVVAAGELEPGDEFAFVLGERTGSRLRAPRFAQRFLFACGVDHAGDGAYRPVAETPAVQVTGAHPDRFRVHAPSSPAADEPFSVTLYPEDPYGNPATGYDGTVTLDADAPTAVDLSGGGEVRRSENETIPSDTYVVDARAPSSGADRVVARDVDAGLLGRSNPVAAGFADRPLFWGEIHGQGYDSIGVGSLEEYFEWGRDVEALDFVATANHYGGRYDDLDDRWRDVVDASNRFYDPGEFVTFVSYEWAGTGYGHKNVYYRGDDGEFYGGSKFGETYDAPEKLWDALREVGRDALTIPHHPKYAGRANWSQFEPEMQRLVEIYSAWGDSEAGGPHSVREGLRRGHRVGFTGGTDTHDGQPGNGPHHYGEGGGLTAVYADDLTRESVFDALHERRTYATTGARLLLDARCAGLRMGAETGAREDDFDARTVGVRAVGTDRIDRVDVVRNGDVVHTRRPEADEVEFEWTDDAPLDDHLRATDHSDGRDAAFYYCRVTQRDRHRAWSSPVWFLGD